MCICRQNLCLLCLLCLFVCKTELILCVQTEPIEVCVCAWAPTCVGGCGWVWVCVGVSKVQCLAEAVRICKKGDRSAAKGSGIWKVENLVFALVTSLVILVNHKALGK